jgi:hypothetical protein
MKTVCDFGLLLQYLPSCVTYQTVLPASNIIKLHLTIRFATSPTVYHNPAYSTLLYPTPTETPTVSAPALPALRYSPMHALHAMQTNQLARPYSRRRQWRLGMGKLKPFLLVLRLLCVLVRERESEGTRQGSQ